MTCQDVRVDRQAQLRTARNEVLFRDTNEAIERGQWAGGPEKHVRFRCECSRPVCGEAIDVTLAEYEQVRQESSRRFLVLAGHQTPEIESVVRSTDRFVVVEKQEAAGELADATDPRI